MVRRILRAIIKQNSLALTVSKSEVRVGDESYDVQVRGAQNTLLIPVKTRETMGGGYALLFTRDIYKSIFVATEAGYACVPIVIAESWTGDLDALSSALSIHIQANPNQIVEIETELVQEMQRFAAAACKITVA